MEGQFFMFLTICVYVLPAVLAVNCGFLCVLFLWAAFVALAFHILSLAGNAPSVACSAPPSANPAAA